jgi:hypothetical protein
MLAETRPAELLPKFIIAALKARPFSVVVLFWTKLCERKPEAERESQPLLQGRDPPLEQDTGDETATGDEESAEISGSDSGDR